VTHPAADFAISPHEPRVGQTLRIVDSSNDPSGVGIAWRAWDFGDGTTATGAAPTHRYACEGEYTITLTIGTFDGRVASTARRAAVSRRLERS
jgi:PKD repeat protein